MSFFYFENHKKRSFDLCHRHECNACPLARQASRLKHPNMKPTGTERPVVYMLGEAPGSDEDEYGEQFVGVTGRFLRDRIPAGWDADLRWNNCVRTRPPKNRTPEIEEVECCRPSIERDIEASKPVAIFGFGAIPLYWATKIERIPISLWRGRRLPIKVRSHTCWFYPMWHPSYVVRMLNDEKERKSYSKDIEFIFSLDIKRAFADVDRELPTPIVYTAEQAKQGIEVAFGAPGDVERVARHLEYASKQKDVGVDYECNMTRPYYDNSKILSAAVATEDKVLAFAIDHPQARWSKEDRDRVWDLWKNFLYRSKCRKLSHGLSFELEWSGKKFGRKAIRAGTWGDSLTQAWVLDERKGAHSLDTLCLLHFGLNIKPISNIDRKNVERTELSRVLPYNGLDARFHLYLFKAQERLIQQQGLMSVYEHMVRRVPTMVLTQLKGVPVNQTAVDYYYNKYNKQLCEYVAAINELAVVKKYRERFRKPFRASSNKDVMTLLTELLNCNVKNVDEETLHEIDDPFAERFIAWRKTAKILSTYIIPLSEGENKSCIYPDGMIHYSLQTTTTDTSRTASNDPNTQNYPKRGKSKEIRRCINKANQKVVSFDYSGMQARNIAMESKDETLVKAFWDRYDIHKDWMEILLRKYPKWINGEDISDHDVFAKYRHKAKNKFVFPSFFGAQPPSMSVSLEIPENIVTKVHEELLHRFPGVDAWHERQFKFYKKHGYVTGCSGVLRRGPITPNVQINAPIQADEALLVCDAMSRLSEMDLMQYQAELEIHDDLTFMWPKEKIDEYAEVVITEMLRIEYDWINVPLQVEMSVGNDWGTTKEVGTYASDEWFKK